ncbi:fimb protein [Melaminivora jejuensis]|uniref:hypothetical protein n=1 Tax=Melaminivora jejuensis TaxID=1267217 RepID=UPI001ADEC365|nr:hypothetical protein [Melaminivora jejuensis]UHJ64745.1 hypothetical protein LVC68_15690 [Melaminivora jejuensis]
MQAAPVTRVRHALRYALRHLLISAAVAVAAAVLVFRLLYPPPWHLLFGVGSMFFLLLAVDVVCGPLLTLIVANPKKSRRERWLDFSLVGLVQLAALLYGLHSVWVARPAVLAFESDRLMAISATEVQIDALAQAPQGLRRLPWWGLQQVGTRKAASNDEFFQSMKLGLSGISPAMRPDWWTPWDSALPAMRARARPVGELLERRPQDAATLHEAIAATGLTAGQLRYLPLTTRKVKEWTALLDADMRIVGYAPIDAF